MVHVYLVPGFLGFVRFGEVAYFRGVREALARSLADAGKEARIIEVPTLPMASLPRRAELLLDQLRKERSLEEADAIHLVGHSTGGLDARLLPSVAAADPGALEALRRRLRTVVCISTPHYGTPLAAFFTTLYGRSILCLLTLVLLQTFNRRAARAAALVLEVHLRAAGLLGLQKPLLRQLTEELLQDISPSDETLVREWLTSIRSDESLLVQLNPQSMEVLRLLLLPLEGVRYLSYATLSPSPLQNLGRLALADARSPLAAAIYGVTYEKTSCPEDEVSYHPPFPPAPFPGGDPPTLPVDRAANDGVVPTLSQVYGELRGVVSADHLDVVGHFGEDRDPDWLVSGAGFDARRFAGLWADVARVLLM